MKKLIIIFVAVFIIYLISIIYRERERPITTDFPLERLGEESDSGVKLYLILYFSMKNCQPCLKVVDFLNDPPEGVKVIGIVPDEEIQLTNEIRQATGAKFPLYRLKQWIRYDPIYAPTLYGVGRDANIYFMIPCVGLEEIYLSGYLAEFMRKANYLLSVPRPK